MSNTRARINTLAHDLGLFKVALLALMLVHSYELVQQFEKAIPFLAIAYALVMDWFLFISPDLIGNQVSVRQAKHAQNSPTTMENIYIGCAITAFVVTLTISLAANITSAVTSNPLAIGPERVLQVVYGASIPLLIVIVGTMRVVSKAQAQAPSQGDTLQAEIVELRRERDEALGRAETAQTMLAQAAVTAGVTKAVLEAPSRPCRPKMPVVKEPAISAPTGRGRKLDEAAVFEGLIQFYATSTETRNSELATFLGIAPRTARVYRDSAMKQGLLVRVTDDAGKPIGYAPTRIS